MASRVLATTLVPPTKLSINKPSYSGSGSALSLSFNVSAKSNGNSVSPRRNIKCKALGESSQQPSFDQTVYNGAYGPWTVDPSDVREVILYRSGLVTAAASFIAAASVAFVPTDSLFGEIIKQNIDLFYTLGAAGLGLSLILIHIYVTEIKRTLQALWVLGVMGSFATYTTLARPAGENLVQYVIDHPTAVWFVGSLFAALTGLVFKEGLMDDGVKLSLLGSWMVLFVIFAGRKFTQPIKDDIGDKSVFMFNALSEDEKKALIEKLEQQN